MSADQYLLDAETRHAVFLQRYSAGTWKRLQPVIQDMRASIVSRLASGPTEFQGQRLNALLSDVDRLVADSMSEMGQGVQREMLELADYESGFQQRLLGKSVTVDPARPTVEQLKASVTTAKMNLVSGSSTESMTTNQLIKNFTTSKQREVRSLIRGGFLEGRTNDQVSRDIGRIIDSRTRRQAQALVRTSMSHASSVANREVMRANKDILEGERYISTLDGRTTVACSGFDGQLFPVGEGPIPPVHYNCRSRRSPSVKPEFAVPGLEGERASIDGPVDSRVTYGGFLKRQSPEFQNEVLGPTRAKLFRSGQVSIDRFTDDAGRLLTLDQLRAVEGLTI